MSAHLSGFNRRYGNLGKLQIYTPPTVASFATLLLTLHMSFLLSFDHLMGKNYIYFPLYFFDIEYVSTCLFSTFFFFWDLLLLAYFSIRIVSFFYSSIIVCVLNILTFGLKKMLCFLRFVHLLSISVVHLFSMP